MKSAEIEVGQEYVYGTKGRWATYRRARVLELGKHQVVDGSDKLVLAARIQLLDISPGDLDPDEEVEFWVVLRAIVMPWAEHEAAEARKQEARQAQAKRAPEQIDRARNVIKNLSEYGFDTGTPNFELVNDHASGLVRVKVEFLEEVLDALA